MFYNYLIQSQKNRNLYIGYTKNLQQRLGEHNRGENKSTKRDIPWKMIYCEICINEKDAKRREKYLKTSQGQRLLKRRLKEFFFIQNSSTGYEKR